MGTASFSFTENAAYMPSSPPSVYAKHTVKLVRQNIVVSGSSFNYSGKDITPYDSYNTTADTRNSVYDDLYVRLYVNINGTYTPLFSDALDCFKYQICNTGSVNTDITGNIYRDVFLPDGSHRKSSITINTSTLFNSNNKTKKVEDIYARIEKVSDNSVIRSVHLEGQAVRYGGQIAITTASGYSVINTVALDAPPTYNSTNVTLSRSPAYAGYTRATVTISSLSAKYGGDISSAVLKIGNQTSASRTTNGDLYIDLSASGTFTPQVVVTDSRGQTTTKNLAQITVLPYVLPSTSFSAIRTSSTGEAEDEGKSAVITATYNFTSAVASLQAPTIVIKDPSSVTLHPVVTWYTDRALTTPISDWSSILTGSTVYALLDNASHTLFNTQYSYQIGITPNDIDVNSDTHSGTTITQILGSAFYTMDFLAGGHGIAFGKASTEEGFDCGMEATFDTAVYLGLSDYQISGSVDKALYDAIVALGWQDVLES